MYYVLSYIPVLVYFLARFFYPKEWSSWMLFTARNNYQTFVLLWAAILIPLITIVNPVPGIPILLIAIYGTISIYREQFKGTFLKNYKTLIPFCVAVIQELYFGFQNQDAIVALVLFYLAGIFVIPFGGSLIGSLL